MRTKFLIIFALAFTMLAPNFASAYSGSHSFSSTRSTYSSSRSSFGSSSTRSSYSSGTRSSSSYSSGSTTKNSGFSFFGSSSRKTSSSTSNPKISLTKSSTATNNSKSFSGGTSTKSKNLSGTTKKRSFSGSSSIKSTKTTGSFSGRTSTVSGKVYKGTPTRTYYHGHSITVTHYYSAGYSPYGWFGYYDGFTTGMFMSSMYHPWGGTYYVGGQYASYGGSPIAWIIDLIFLLILLSCIAIFVIAAVRIFSPSKKIYTRRF